MLCEHIRHYLETGSETALEAILEHTEEANAIVDELVPEPLDALEDLSMLGPVVWDELEENIG